MDCLCNILGRPTWKLNVCSICLQNFSEHMWNKINDWQCLYAEHQMYKYCVTRWTLYEQYLTIYYMFESVQLLLNFYTLRTQISAHECYLSSFVVNTRELHEYSLLLFANFPIWVVVMGCKVHRIVATFV